MAEPDELTRILAQYADPQRSLRNPLYETALTQFRYDPYELPTPEPKPRGEIRNLPARPADPFAAPLAEALSPTMGAYGIGQLLADTYGKAREGDWGGLAGNAPLLLGIFAGPRAKTANHAMLSRAQEMAKKGAGRDAIWHDTGWFQGADGKWRFEIPDTGTKLTRAGMEFNTAGGHPYEVGKFNTRTSPFAHPKLSEAYPNENILMSFDHHSPMEMGAFRPPDPKAGRSNALIDIWANNPGEARSVALHELQHAVQTREGFAPGSNVEAAISRLDWIPRVEAEMDRLLPLYRNEPKFMGLRDSDIRPALRAQAEANIKLHEYNRSAGEVEARNVQRRRNYSDKQRRARPPWETEIIPRDQQFVRDPD